MKNVSYPETNICRRDPLPKSGASLCTRCCYWRKAASPKTFSVPGTDGSHWVQDRDYRWSGKNIYREDVIKGRKRVAITKNNLSRTHDRRSHNRRAMTHALSDEEEREQQTALPEFSLVQISLAERRVLTTWSQMEVRAVVRYE
ncbi:hypothetical protein AVEN_104196-1 [Araneus ventricosus]|uniref:Uncharacterized protein n=1 Tax=Araneus ventricosus TaxID=182803 RepID=A0A4Y2WJI0_ARAVE|nr:hypothetical protein AVEN_104196-1 [Araneus ventricosus]